MNFKWKFETKRRKFIPLTAAYQPVATIENTVLNDNDGFDRETTENDYGEN